MNLTPRFIGFYMALGAVVVAAFVGVYVAATVPVSHRVARIERQLGNNDLAAQATSYVTQAAAQQGYGVKNVKVTRTSVKGDDAQVYVTVTLTYAGSSQTVKLKVGFHKGVWTATGLQPA